MGSSAHTTSVDENLFVSSAGQQLLRFIRDHKNLKSATNGKLRELVLKRIPPRYTDKEKENERRLDARKVYNNLLLIALDAENQDLQRWTVGDSAKEWWINKPVELLGSGSIFKHLLDDLLEHEDIMFKFYSPKPSPVQAWQKLGLHWLVDSLKIYRKYLVNHILRTVLDSSIGEHDELLASAIARAKEEFQKKVPVESSWRYKARMYWLLARAVNMAPHGTQPAKLKGFDYCGPIGTLVQELITDDNKVLLEKDGDSLIGQPPQLNTAEENGIRLGIFMKSPSLLAYASAKNDHVLVKCILQSKKQFEKHDEHDFGWEDSWKKTWANALWIAAYKGSGLVVKELLKYSSLYSPEQYKIPEKSVQPPLHVAVHIGHISVVDAFCSAESKSDFSCHDEDYKLHKTPLEVAKYLKDKPTRKKIQSTLLQRAEVKQAVKESYTQRELTVSSANAIMVGAALIASVTYAGWLQPPLGYHNYYQFTEPVPGAPDAPESYMFVRGHTSIRVFAIFNSLSFFFAIAAMISGMETYFFIEDLEDMYTTEIVRKMRNQLKRTRISFIASVVFVLIAFSSAAIAVVPPIKLYRRDTYITIGLGGFICLVFIGRILFSFSKRRAYERIRSSLGLMFTDMKEKFCNT